jgi:hypothetical protein
MSYTVERLIKFKTVPSRWEPQSICDTKEQADDMVLMYTSMLSRYSRANGGLIAAYRVKNHDAYPTEQLSVEEMVRVLNVRTQRLNDEQPLDKV